LFIRLIVASFLLLTATPPLLEMVLLFNRVVRVPEKLSIVLPKDDIAPELFKVVMVPPSRKIVWLLALIVPELMNVVNSERIETFTVASKADIMPVFSNLIRLPPPSILRVFEFAVSVPLLIIELVVPPINVIASVRMVATEPLLISVPVMLKIARSITRPPISSLRVTPLSIVISKSS